MQKKLFLLNEDFETHMKIHSSSPPSKKLKNFEELKSDTDQMDTETKTEKHEVEDHTILDAPYVKLPEENKEVDIFFEQISKIHECKDELTITSQF